MKKGTPITRGRPSSIKHPDYRIYRDVANKYLDLEERLRKCQAELEEKKKECYRISNAMSDMSGKSLQLLGHRIVDMLRRERANEEDVS